MPIIAPIDTWEEVTIKAQELTDRLDAQLAWIGAAQSSADSAQADATQALGTIFQTGLDANIYTDEQIQLLRGQLTGNWATTEANLNASLNTYVDTVYAGLIADVNAANAAHTLTIQAIEDDVWNVFGTAQASLDSLSNTELPSVNAFIQSLTGDVTALQDGITILTTNMGSASIYDEINAHTAALKSTIEDPLGNSVGATLTNNYLTAVGTQNAISAANLALKSEIEDPSGTSIGATLENSYYTSADADTAIAGQISTYDASISGGLAASVGSHTTAISNLEGNASASYVMRVKAGTVGAELELVAADDPINGPSSSVRLAADDIILDGSVFTRHIDTDGLTANWLRSQYITAGQMLIDGDGNLVPNGSLAILDDNNFPAGWSTYVGDGLAVTSNILFPAAKNYFYGLTESDSQIGNGIDGFLIPVTPGEKLLFEFDYSVISGPGEGTLAARIKQRDGTTNAGEGYIAASFSGQATGNNIRKVSATVTVPVDTYYISSFDFIQKDGRVRASNFSVRRMNAAALIVQGGIEADFLQIDHVTIDTDGSGTLIIKDGGVDNGKIADNAVTDMGAASGTDPSLLVAEAFCRAGADIFCQIFFTGAHSIVAEENSRNIRCKLTVNNTARVETDFNFPKASSSEATYSMIWHGIAGGNSDHTLIFQHDETIIFSKIILVMFTRSK